MQFTLIRPAVTEPQAAATLNAFLVESQGERVSLEDIDTGYTAFAMEAISDELVVEGTLVWVPGVTFKALFQFINPEPAGIKLGVE